MLRQRARSPVAVFTDEAGIRSTPEERNVLVYAGYFLFYFVLITEFFLHLFDFLDST